MCPEKHVERGTPKGYTNTGLRTTRNGEKRTMARTVEERVNELHDRVTTYNLAVCGNCVSELAQKCRAGGAR